MKRVRLAIACLGLGALMNSAAQALDLTPGRIDPTFVALFDPEGNPGELATIYRLVVQPDGKIILGGYFRHVGGAPRISIARLEADGRLDQTFSPNDWPDGSVHAIGVQSDGRILVAGSFRHWGDRLVPRMIRLHPDGRFDETFAQPVLPSVIECLLVLADDRIIYSGRGQIRRLRANGEPDETFRLEPGFTATARDMLIDPSGRIVAAGQMLGPEGTMTCVMRLLPDGSRDPSFSFSIWETVAHAVRQQPDGRLLVAGDFHSWASAPASADGGIFRLHSDGTIDRSFQFGVSRPFTVHTLGLQDNGRIVIGSSQIFWETNPLRWMSISRLEPNGELDRGFVPEGGADWSCQAIQMLRDGRILAAGAESLRQGVPVGGLRRYFGDPPSAKVSLSGNEIDFRWPIMPPELGLILEESEVLDPRYAKWQPVTDVQTIGLEQVVRRPLEQVFRPKFLRLRAP